MSIQRLLGGGEGSRKPKEGSDETKKLVSELVKIWNMLYIEHVIKESGAPQYFVTPRERKHIKTLVESYGSERTSELIHYYLENWSTIKYITGWPTIAALFGFRHQLVMDMTRGPRQIDGQYRETSAEEMLRQFNED